MLFAVPYHECNIYGMACKLYMLLHTKQLVVDNHINCWWPGSNVLSILHPTMMVLQCFYYVLCNWLGVLGWCNTL